MIAVDLKAAKIAPETDSGIVDFHALRGSYISHLVASGASVKTCQMLARHSTPSLTIGVYAKASLHDIKGAVEALPDLATNRPQPEALAATGTEGNSGPTATEIATGPLSLVTEHDDAQNVMAICGADLKPSVVGGPDHRQHSCANRLGQFRPCIHYFGKTGIASDTVLTQFGSNFSSSLGPV